MKHKDKNLNGGLESQLRLYEAVLSNTPDLVYIFNIDGRFRYANTALLNMWGKSWEEAIGRNCLELGYEPWHAAMHDREIADVIKTKSPIRGEVPFTGTNGTRIYDYIFTPVLDADGNVEAIAGTTRDVTDRKKSEEILREGAAKASFLASIIASSNDSIISKDKNGNITSWNPGAEKIFGFTAAEAAGRHISIIIPPEKLGEEDYILNQIRQGKYVNNFETYRRRKDGSLISISVTVSPIKDSNGDVLGASSVARDVSALKEAEKTSAYLAAIIESSDDAIISKDLNGFIRSWNKSAERIFGYTADEVVGKHITIIIPSERLEEEEKIIRTLKNGDRIDHFETMRRHKSGNLIPISLTVSPIRDYAGNIIGASKVSRDISERINAQKALKESSQKKDEFLANMSHELRTPMNAVIGLANLLQSMQSMPEKAIKYIYTLKTSADHLMDLINDLLDFAKIEADSFEIERVEFNLAQEVEKVISVMNVRAQEKNLQLFVNYDPVFKRYYMGDPLRIYQILMNLLSNAVKFTETGSVEIDICGEEKAADDKTFITFKISDTGIGIPEEKLGVIFEKFTQADSSITRRFGGSGLGLSITKAYVEKMGGTIGIESQLGLGTTFTVTIPLENTCKESNIDSFSARTAPGQAKQKKNVLLVEDYEPNVLVAASMIQDLGYSCEVAKNGLDALRKFMNGDYEVILMDVQMSELDGLQATRRIRAIEAEKGLNRTPIIAMTAHVREQDKDRCLDAGMDDFIPKPFDPSVLAHKINKYINQDWHQYDAAGNSGKRQSDF